MSESEGNTGRENDSWRAARAIVRKIHPASIVVTNVLRPVFGKMDQPSTVNPEIFSPLAPLFLRVGKDNLFDVEGGKDYREIVMALGADVAASIAYIYAFCQSTVKFPNEAIWKPILEEALLRARIGYYVGQVSTGVPAGAAIFTGFSTRCGMATQIVYGTNEDAEVLHNNIVAGKDLLAITEKLYGCSHFQVAAQALLTAGCHRDMALSFLSLGSHTGMAMGLGFLLRGQAEVIDSFRIGSADMILPEIWENLHLDETKIETLEEATRSVIREGHQMDWCFTPLTKL